MHQILFRLGQPRWGDYSACLEPLEGAGLLVREWEGGKEKEGRGLRKGREGKGGEEM